MRANAPRESAAVDTRDEALAIVAHELRHPLAAIASWTELLKQRDLTDAQRRRALEIIARSAAAQRRILDDLYDHACIVHGQLRLQRARVNVAELATTTAEAMSPVAAERHVDVAWWASRPAPVHGDADRLTQVFANLIANAIRHSPGGSRIAVEVERLDGHVLVRVRDSGVGIAPHLLPHLFEPFRRGEQATSRGLGLGLAISRDIVERHQGTILAESAGQGLGATFTVRLPCLGESSESQENWDGACPSQFAI
jgi:signal transduction histidine kinase